MLWIVVVFVAALAALIVFLLRDQGTPQRASARAWLIRRSAFLFLPSGQESIPEARDHLERVWSAFKLPSQIQREDLSADGIPVTWIHHKDMQRHQALLVLHGGGYALGSIETHKTYAYVLSEAARAPALVIDYRLAPEHPFPAALDDAYVAFHWLEKQGIPASKIVLFGDSAGGGLAAALTLRLKEENQPLPAAILLASPWLDLTMSGDSIKTNAARDVILSRPALETYSVNYAATHALEHPLISPVFGDLKGFPPTLIMVSGDELFRSECELFAERLSEAQVDVTLQVWPAMIHDWPLMNRFIPEGKRAINALGRFARRHLDAQ
ncbi:MAG: alpha/beta hydrolase [Chloroflexi bacterium]|nr:alpha/beta hydrolase [Chloroflexota bacterium]